VTSLKNPLKKGIQKTNERRGPRKSQGCRKKRKLNSKPKVRNRPSNCAQMGKQVEEKSKGGGSYKRGEGKHQANASYFKNQKGIETEE